MSEIKISPIGIHINVFVPEKQACAHLNITSMQRTGERPLHVCTDCGDTLTKKQARAEFVDRSCIGVTLGTAICKALNLDPGKITSLQLTIESGSVPVLVVGRAIMGKDHELLQTVFEQYSLTPIASAQQANSDLAKQLQSLTEEITALRASFVSDASFLAVEAQHPEAEQSLPASISPTPDSLHPLNPADSASPVSNSEIPASAAV